MLRQTDTYFRVETGRLKIREFSRGRAELIYYRRNERKGARWSEYEIVTFGDAKNLKRILARLLGVWVVVRKSRLLFYYKGIARVHIDHVQGLGDFIEIEVIAKRNRRKVKLVHDELIGLLGIRPDEKIACSYSDLIDSNADRLG